MLIAERLQHHGGILENLGLLVEIGERVHAAVGQDQHAAQRGNLIEHAVRGEVARAQAMLLVEYGAHQIGGAEDALHQEVRLALGAERDGLGGAVLISVTGDNLIGDGILTGLAQHLLDLGDVADENGGRDALLAGLDNGLDHGLVMRGRDGDNAGLAALGRLENPVNGVNHLLCTS